MKWSRKYDVCQQCNTINFKHKGLGLCTSCYDKKRFRENPNCTESRRRYRFNNIDRVKEANRKHHRKNRNRIYELLGNVCCKCGYSDKRALQIDHINGGGRLERIKYNTKDFHRVVIKSLENNEEKYQLLCANCNWIKRYENKEWGK